MLNLFALRGSFTFPLVLRFAFLNSTRHLLINISVIRLIYPSVHQKTPSDIRTIEKQKCGHQFFDTLLNTF